MRKYLSLLAPFLFVAGAYAADAPPLPPDVLVRNQWMQLTRADYEAELERLPKAQRFDFTASPSKIQSLLNRMLVMKTLAAQGKAHGGTAKPSFEKGPRAESERALAKSELKRLEDDANKAFDERRPQFEAKARELYSLDREKYRVPEQVRISDITILIKDRGEAAALERAKLARERVMAGTDFAAVAREFSEDPTTRDKGGALPFVTAKSMSPEYSQAVFAITKIGEVSQPIKAPSAYHVVRMEERRPSRIASFEEVSPKLMDQLRAQYVSEQREARLQAIYKDPGLQINQPAVNALVVKVDQNLYKTPSQTPGGAPQPKAAQ